MEEESKYEEESIEEVLKKSDHEVMNYLRDQVYFIMKQADMNKKIFVAFMNTILNNVENRLYEKEKLLEMLTKHEC